MGLFKTVKSSQLRWIFMFASICCILMIFLFSSQNSFDSNKLSAKALTYISKVANKFFNLSDNNLRRINVYGNIMLRKLAHFFNYFCLGIFSSLFLLFFNLDNTKRLFTVTIFGFQMAFLDEWYQTSIPGRTGSVVDVMIDSTGVFFGALLICIFVGLIGFFRNHKQNIKN